MRSRTVPGFRSRGRARVLVASGVVVAAAALLLVPVEVPDRVEGMGRVQPRHEWVLARTSSGAVTATLRDHRTGAVSTTFAAEPARGDAVQFDLGPVASQQTIEAGEVVGTVASGEAALRLSAVRGQIKRAEAELRLLRAGSIEPVVDAARQEVRHVRTRLALAETSARRQRELHKLGVTSTQDREAAEGAVALAQAELAAAQARVQAAASGGRAEEADVVRAEIDALQRQAASLAQREAMGTLVAPISGRVGRVFSPDTLLLVSDVSAYRVLIPVRWADRERVRLGATVTLGGTLAEAPPRARVVDLREAPAPTSGQAYLIATAEVTTGAEHLVPGLLVRCAIEADPKTPLDHVRGALADLFQW